MLCATPLGLCGRGYKSIILLIWNPYGVLRDIETQNIASLQGGDGVPFAKKSHIDSTLVVRLGAWSSKKIICNAIFTGIADYFGMPFHV